MNDDARWLTLALLGSYHGINPAMGWLFAVALGLQRQSRRAVLGALVPIAIGHEASVAVAVLLAALAGAVASPEVLRPVAAVAMFGFGLFKFLRPQSHPRWVGMRVSSRDLVVWSFLMSSAHGAGLMLFPVLLGWHGAAAALGHQHESGEVHVHLLDGGPAGVALMQDAAAVIVHTAAMLAVMAIVAVVVYEKLGLAVLRRAWVNFDAVWAVAVMAAGAFTLFT